MKKTLLLLTLTLTASIANTGVSEKLTVAQSMEILTNNQIIIREVPTPRESRTNREIRAERVIKIEKIQDIIASPIARNSREVRKNRFIVQTVRESRKVRHVFIQDNLHIAKLK